MSLACVVGSGQALTQRVQVKRSCSSGACSRLAVDGSIDTKHRARARERERSPCAQAQEVERSRIERDHKVYGARRCRCCNFTFRSFWCFLSFSSGIGDSVFVHQRQREGVRVCVCVFESVFLRVHRTQVWNLCVRVRKNARKALDSRRLPGWSKIEHVFFFSPAKQWRTLVRLLASACPRWGSAQTTVPSAVPRPRINLPHVYSKQFVKASHLNISSAMVAGKKVVYVPASLKRLLLHCGKYCICRQHAREGPLLLLLLLYVYLPWSGCIILLPLIRFTKMPFDRQNSFSSAPETGVYVCVCVCVCVRERLCAVGFMFVFLDFFS